MLMGQPLIRSLLWKHLLCLRQLSWLASACFCNWRKHSAVIVKALSFYHPWASINFCSTSQFEKVWYAWTSWTYARHPANICKYMVFRKLWSREDSFLRDSTVWFWSFPELQFQILTFRQPESLALPRALAMWTNTFDMFLYLFMRSEIRFIQVLFLFRSWYFCAKSNQPTTWWHLQGQNLCMQSATKLSFFATKHECNERPQ